MDKELTRRQFLQATAAGGALCLGAGRFLGGAASAAGSPIISPGCRGTKVKVGKVYMGPRGALWPTPKLDLVRQAAHSAGTRSLQEEGIVLVAKGVTSLQELMRVLKQ